MSEWSLKLNVDIQKDFSNKPKRTGRKITIDNSVRYIRKSERTKEKNIDKYKNIDPNVLLEIYRKNYSDRYNDKELIVEDVAVFAEFF